MMKVWRGTQAPGPQRLAQQQSKVDYVAEQQEKMETEDVSQVAFHLIQKNYSL